LNLCLHKADCVGSCLRFMTKRLCWPVALACGASKFFGASAHHTHTRNETTHMSSVPLSFFVILTYLRQHVTHDLPMFAVESLRRLTLAIGCCFLPSAEHSTHNSQPTGAAHLSFFCTTCVPCASRMCCAFER
jgi:hypothetical protein